jgi:uracil-DNA glycosylase family 4
VIRFVLTAPDSILGLMSDNATKLQYLDAMGIQVWQRRHLDEPAAVPLTPETNPADDTAITAGTDVSQLDWQSLAEVVSGCQQCELHQARTQTVFGVGDRKARWVFVGEAPGADEDRQGEPFVGRAGQLLNAMLFALGLKREEVYIANVLKCRPPGNRNPRPQEVECCEPYLLRQLELIQPAIIVALGRHAVHSLLKTDLALGQLRKTRHDYHGTPLVATYHPAYLLRSPQDKAKAWEDLKLAQSIVGTS